jgi:membrane-bound inhibitor of C-type lysozyme
MEKTMKIWSLARSSLAGLILAAPTLAFAAPEPPMNKFNYAYYDCDNGGSFEVDYDAAQPETAKLDTFNGGPVYQLKRDKVATGVEFSNGATKFWTDGAQVVVSGTHRPFLNCKIKQD